MDSRRLYLLTTLIEVENQGETLQNMVHTNIGMELLNSIQNLRQLANTSKNTYNNDSFTLHNCIKSNRCH